MTSLAMSAAAKSRTDSSHDAIDEAIAILRDKAIEFAQLTPAARAALVRECIPTTQASIPMWMETSIAAKGLTAGASNTSEEYLGGPLTTIRNLRMLAESLEQIAATGKPVLKDDRFTTAPDGVTEVKVFPSDTYDSLLFAGFTAKVRMEKGMSAADVKARQASAYSQKGAKGGVSLVLGAGNVSSIPPMDALYKLFTDNHVVLLKMNPVNEYLGPVIEKALAPLVSKGYLRIVYGGAEVGSYLTYHAGIDDVHITGSDHTHDMIVWGPPGAERDRRKAAKDPVLKKPITSELGSVTPVMVVPGDYSASELDFISQNVATMVANNASCNCNAAKMLVTSKGWGQREEFLARVKAVLAGIPSRKAYYSGAHNRFHALLDGRTDVEKLGAEEGDVLPWALVFGLDSKNPDEKLFTTEPFCPILSETTLDAREPAAFLAEATTFCNERLFGTLSAVIMIHPDTEKDPAVKQALDRAVAALRYGAVGINHWTGLVYAFVSTPWGAHPSSTLENIQGGLGWVHNTYMLEGIEKVVMRGPITVFPKPAWFVTNKNAQNVAAKMASFEASPSLLKVPGVVIQALQG